MLEFFMLNFVVLDGYMQGATIQTIRARAENELKKKLHQLRPEEAAVVAFLQKRLTQKEQPLEKMLRRSISRIKKHGGRKGIRVHKIAPRFRRWF